VKFEEGIARSLKWLEEHPDYCEIDEANNELIDKIISKYESALPA
jgi:hypothetical protein